MKGIDRNRHETLLRALHELLPMTDDNTAVETDIAALTGNYNRYMALLDTLRAVVADYEALHIGLRLRTCRDLRRARRLLAQPKRKEV